MSELCDLAAADLQWMIANGEVSPVEVYESCCARIDAVNPTLNAVVAENRKAAREAAEAAELAVRQGEPLGPLHGLPLGVKDLNDTAGLRTTYGSPLFADQVPEADEPMVARLRAAGALVAGKTNTPEFGAGANTTNAVYGATGNPFDPDLTCAGSSGGSAVALATSMFPLCTGSDLGGSLRTPAAFCGVVGLRPSYGRVPVTDSESAFLNMAVEGPMARSVADVALLFSAMVAEDPRDPQSRPPLTTDRVAPQAADLSALRVAFSEDLGFAPVCKDSRERFRARATSLERRFQAHAWQDPDLGEATCAFEILRAIGFLAAHRQKVEKTPEKVGPNVRANVELGLGFSAGDVAWAAAEQTRLYRRFLEFMADFDLLICPAAAIPPFPKEQLYPTEIDGEPMETYITWIAITYGLTLTGHPVLCLPCGRDAQGLPFGIQVVGRRNREDLLLAAGLALEEALAESSETTRPRPDLAVLSA